MQVENHIEKHLSKRVVNKISIGTGIFQAYKVKLNSGDCVFIKYQQKSDNSLINEAKELKLLGNTVNTPEVLGCCEHCLILHWIEESYNPNKQSQMGYQLAKLHKNTGKYFGFSFDNKIGKTEQLNAVGKNINNWPDFFWEYRILYQIEMAYENKLLSQKHYLEIMPIENFLGEILSDDIKPSLIHGDLWSGNTISDKNNTYFIDTASYYGHREIDFALTFMFGGFNKDFYLTYNEEFPFEDGFENRKPLYMLYHYLNHLNIFGSSYSSGVIKCINKIRSTYRLN